MEAGEAEGNWEEKRRKTLFDEFEDILSNRGRLETRRRKRTALEQVEPLQRNKRGKLVAGKKANNSPLVGRNWNSFTLMNVKTI